VTDLRFPASPDEGDMLTEFFHGGWYRIDHRASRGWATGRIGSGRHTGTRHRQRRRTATLALLPGIAQTP
jgi:hypothetical protein